MTVTSPPSENRVLALETIRMAGQRARTVQQVLVDSVHEVERGLDVGADVDADTERPGSVYRSGDASLPSTAVTNTNLHHYLASAMATQPGFATGEPPGGIRSRLRRLVRSPGQQHYNAAVLHVLHQLDHRSRAQEDRIVALEAEVAHLRRLVARANRYSKGERT